MTTGALIYLVSSCASGEEFIAAFRRYADRSGLFVPMADPIAAGRRGRFAVALTGGGVMIEGEAEVVSSARTPSVLHGRVGMTLRFVEPDGPSKTVLVELEKARLAMKPPPPSVPPRPAAIPAAPRAVPPAPAGRVDATNALAECVAIGDVSALAVIEKAALPPKAGPKFVVPTIPPVGAARPPAASPPPSDGPAIRPTIASLAPPPPKEATPSAPLPAVRAASPLTKAAIKAAPNLLGGSFGDGVGGGSSEDDAPTDAVSIDDPVDTGQQAALAGIPAFDDLAEVVDGTIDPPTLTKELDARIAREAEASGPVQARLAPPAATSLGTPAPPPLVGKPLTGGTPTVRQPKLTPPATAALRRSPTTPPPMSAAKDPEPRVVTPPAPTSLGLAVAPPGKAPPAVAVSAAATPPAVAAAVTATPPAIAATATATPPAAVPLVPAPPIIPPNAVDPLAALDVEISGEPTDLTTIPVPPSDADADADADAAAAPPAAADGPPERRTEVGIPLGPKLAAPATPALAAMPPAGPAPIAAAAPAAPATPAASTAAAAAPATPAAPALAPAAALAPAPPVTPATPPRAVLSRPPLVEEPTPSGDWTMIPGADGPTIQPRVTGKATAGKAPAGSPTGDWSISLDPKAADGWSEPAAVEKAPSPARGRGGRKSSNGSLAEVVSSKEPLESEPRRPVEDVAISEPKVQVDPTLIEPLLEMPPVDEGAVRSAGSQPEIAPPSAASSSGLQLHQVLAPPSQAPMPGQLAPPLQTPMPDQLAPGGSTPFLGAASTYPMDPHPAAPFAPRPGDAVALPGETGPAPRISSVTLTAEPNRRRRMIVIVASAALVVTLGLIVLVLMSGGDTAAPEPSATPPAGASGAAPPGAQAPAGATAPDPAPSPAGHAVEPGPGAGSAETGAPGDAAPGAGNTSRAGDATVAQCPFDVISTPAGAEVVLDKAVIGTTPATLSYPCDVPLRLTIKKAKLGAIERKFTPTAKSAPLKVAFAKPTYLVKVSSSPPGATITVGGRSLGITPTTVKLPAGEVSTLTLTKEGYLPDTQKLTPRPNQSVQATLKRRGRVFK